MFITRTNYIIYLDECALYYCAEAAQRGVKWSTPSYDCVSGFFTLTMSLV